MGPLKDRRLERWPLDMSMEGWPCGSRNSGNRALKMDLDCAQQAESSR